MRTRQSRRRPSLVRGGPAPAVCERVERRLLLAGDITYADGTLHVISDGTSNTVFFAETFQGATVVLDGQTYTFPAVHTLDIDTGDGDDVVSVQARSDGGMVDVSTHTGSGDDQVDATFATGQGEAQPLHRLRLEVDAGGGADRVEVDYDNQRGAQALDVVLSVHPGGVGRTGGVLPEVDDEVLVGFSHGEASNRLYVGNLSWNSVDPVTPRLPPAAAAATFAADTSQEKPLFAFTVVGLDGRDDVSTSALLLPAVQKVREAAFHLDLGGGDNAAQVRFGDGLQGARPPDGGRVVRAAYRGGAGSDTVGVIGDMSSHVDVGLDFATGEGDDAVAAEVARYHLTDAWPSKVSGPIDLGAGNDRVQVDVSGFDEVANDITTGDGDDAVLIGLLLPAVQKVRDAAARASADLGAGNNSVEIAVDGFDDVAARIDAAGGKNTARMKCSNNLKQMGIALHMGDGINDVTIESGTPATRPAWPVKYSGLTELGGGNNRVRIDVSGYDSVVNDLKAGGGDNEILIGMLLPAVQKVRAAAAATRTTLGDGDNRVTIDVSGYDRGAADLTAGDGDNEILVGMLLPAVQKVRASAANTRVELGGGANSLNVRMTGPVDPALGKPKEIVVVGSKIRDGTVEAGAVPGRIGQSWIEVKGLAVDGALDARLGPAGSTAVADADFALSLADARVGAVVGRATRFGPVQTLSTLVDGLTVTGSASVGSGNGSLAPRTRLAARVSGLVVRGRGAFEFVTSGGPAGDTITYLQDAAVIEPGAAAAVKLSGGGGSDGIVARVRGASGGGAFSLLADGGDGNDLVVADVALFPDPPRDPLARAEIRVLGGAGDDWLSLAVLPDDRPVASVLAILDGGDGIDSCSATQNVEVLGCEIDVGPTRRRAQ